MIYHTDAMHGLALLGSESVDCIVSDPPYKTISGGRSADPDKHKLPGGMLAVNDGKGGLEYNAIRAIDYAAEIYRVLKNPGHVWLFTNELNRRSTEDAMLLAGFKTHYLGGWIKNTVTPNRWGMKNGELVFLFRKGVARTLYNPSLKQFIEAKNPAGRKCHPNEKPVELMREFVLASSLPGETVLDMFCGSGSVGVACRETGREFIGFEIDPAHYATAVTRYNAEVFG
ncbi:DNA modification methylase [Phaeobacter inhibens]|uniref:Methyltransferase n=1 Tax=Phaeobacter inhibens TaxID=221822 RepID=A0ABN5GQY1_9RHOB|nr:site-specific DNA-methyltransferase [Phaeobacter inhibens]AUQ95995.1 DNA modification methylase [Phaeobacter inhibens]